MRLDSSARKLQCLLAGAVATTQPVVTVFYTDTANGIANATKPQESKFSALNSATPVDVCDAPDPDAVRDIDEVNLHNLDTASVTATFRYNESGTTYKITSVTLAAGEKLAYTEAGGWRAFDTAGNEKR